jgi:hypothetical protein
MKAHHHHTESRIMQNGQFTAASRTFHGAITEYLEHAGYAPVSWALWLDIRGMAKSGKIVDAIKLLWDASSVYGTNPVPLPIPNQTASSFTEFCHRRVTQQVLHCRLELLTAKQIVDLLVANENFFD